MPDPAPNSNSCDVNNCWRVQGNIPGMGDGGTGGTGETGGGTPQVQQPTGQPAVAKPTPTVNGIDSLGIPTKTKPDLMAPSSVATNPAPQANA